VGDRGRRRDWVGGEGETEEGGGICKERRIDGM
jgi:hypothetical protein